MGGNNVEWNPNNIAKNWMNVCQGLQGLPFISQTLWQVGPMPWLQSNVNSWFGNSNWGNCSDSLQIGNSPKKIDTADDVNEEKPVDESNMTAEEKLAAREEKAAKKAEKQKFVDKYNKMYTVLKEYGENLSDSTDPTKTVFEEVLKSYPKNMTSSTATETLNRNYHDLDALYKKYADKIKPAILNNAKKEITSTNNTEYTTKVTSLNTAISNNTNAKFGILKDGGNGSYEWNDDIDILELLSTWNSNDTTKSKHIMSTLSDKRKAETNGTKKSQLDTLANKLHEKLLSVAENIDEEKLSDETKAILKEANDNLEAFSAGNRLEKEKDYSNAFDNLYRAIRLAKAEIAEKELKEKFDFLGDQNPYKTLTFVSDTKADINNEGLKDKRAVTVPTPAEEKTVAELAAEKGYRTTNYSKAYYSETEKKHYYYDETSKEFKKIDADIFEILEDGTCRFKYLKNGKEVRKPFSEVIASSNTPEANASGTGTGSAPQPNSVENTVGKNYNELKYLDDNYDERANLYNLLHGKHKSGLTLNKENVIGFIDSVAQETDDPYKSSTNTFITTMTQKRFDKNNCNRIIKAVMRQALSIGLNSNNCQEYKTLAEYFGAQGTPSYKEDGFTPDNDSRSGKDTFEFTKHCENKEKYEVDEAKEIDVMLKALIDKIKEINKTS